ncbi:MAG TPA: CheR family methyltransferase [Hyphomicrobiaceae bacterium]|nr:CheR family methyltransferase [Hyphomicrobiaceae bacterium]
MGSNEPAAMRPIQGRHTGTTAFFRNRAFTRCLIELIRELPRTASEFRMLFHSCSVGAEPYSFVMEAKLSGLYDELPFTIHATDIEPRFLDVARAAVYEAESLSGVPAEAHRFFRDGPRQGTVTIDASITGAVALLPPASFVDFSPREPYDVVLAMNSLAYVSPEEQAVAIKRMASYARGLLCVTAFSPDIIGDVMRAAGFHPVLRHWREIYYGWTNRLRFRPGKRGTPRHSWVLPRLPLFIKDRSYKIVSIFEPDRAEAARVRHTH